MAFLRFYTFILLVSYSLCFAENDYDSRENKSERSGFANAKYHQPGEAHNHEGAHSKHIHRNEKPTPTECPPGQSLLSKKDIIAMINYLESKLNISEVLISAYNPKAKAVRDKHISSLEDIKTKLETRPEHLKHILADIDGNRMKLEPIIDALVSKLQDYNTYEEKFVNANGRAQKVLDTLDKYKQLCKFNNCDEPKLMMRQSNNVDVEMKTATNEDYYCTSLKHLHQRIHTNLTDFQHAYNDVMTRKINSDNANYTMIITNITNTLKESGVYLFGMTMYNILNLQDEYHNYVEDLNAKSNVTAVLNMIGKNILEIELKLMELRDGVAKYHQYCLNCKPKNGIRKAVLRNLFNNRPNQPPKKMETSTKIQEMSKESIPNIEKLNVEVLIQSKIDSIKYTIENISRRIFEGLDKVVNDRNLINSYVEKLKPIKENVGDDLVVRQDVFIHLKSKLQQTMFDHVYELSEKSVQLLNSVKSALDFVNKYA